jgi:membrane associated rhomboid family serine protease
LEVLYCSSKLRDKGNVTMQPREPAPRATAKVALARAAGGVPATVWFAALSIAVYLALMSSSGGPSAPISGRMALRWGALAGDLGWREPWRQLSAIFVHFGLLHIGFNLFALFSFGRVLERVLGSARFAVLLLVTGALGFVASDLWYALFPPQQITGGLSGGIFGLLGAEVGLRFAAGDAGWKRAALSGAGYALMMALIPGQTVNNAAHVGGLLSGGLLGWALSYAASRAYQRFFNVAALLLCAATLGAIAASRWG